MYLVTGVNGGVGRSVAGVLHERGHAVVGASSHPDRLGPRPYPVVPMDWDDPGRLRPVLDGVRSVFLYPARTGLPEVAAELARADLAHVVVMTSAVAEHPAGGAMAEQFARVEQTLTAAGLPLTCLRPDVFATNTLAWAPQIRAEGRVSLPLADAQVAPVHEADIADAAVAALTDDRHLGQAYVLTGPESMTQRRQVEVLGSALGRDLAVDELSVEDWQASVAAFLPAPVSAGLARVWAAAVGVPQRTDRTVQQVTGQQPRSYAAWVQEHLDDFR